MLRMKTLAAIIAVATIGLTVQGCSNNSNANDAEPSSIAIGTEAEKTTVETTTAETTTAETTAEETTEVETTLVEPAKDTGKGDNSIADYSDSFYKLKLEKKWQSGNTYYFKYSIGTGDVFTVSFDNSCGYEISNVEDSHGTIYLKANDDTFGMIAVTASYEYEVTLDEIKSTDGSRLINSGTLGKNKYFIAGCRYESDPEYYLSVIEIDNTLSALVLYDTVSESSIRDTLGRIKITVDKSGFDK